MLQQLPLEFKLLEQASFSSFFTGNNQQLIFSLQNFLTPNIKQEFFYLWGKNQVGKTHLLQASCNHALANNIHAMYLSFNSINFNYINSSSYIDDFFFGLDEISLLCLDDLQLIEEQIYLQEKLFYLFNNIRSNNNKLIIAAKDSPNGLNLSLSDLKSRLSWGITYHLQELTDQQKISALIMRAEQIGLQIGENVAKFLLFRIPRDTGKLFNVLERLDLAALVATKRKITIPFVREVLNI